MGARAVTWPAPATAARSRSPSGSPWIDGKALAIASPAALVGARPRSAWLAGTGRRTEAIVGAARHRGRSALVERARLPRCVARAAKPAARARGDRQAVLGRRACADDRVRAVRRPAFPPQAGCRERVGAAPPSDPAPRRTEVAKGEYADIDRVPARRDPRLPHARARALALCEPPAVRLPARAGADATTTSGSVRSRLGPASSSTSRSATTSARLQRRPAARCCDSAAPRAAANGRIAAVARPPVTVVNLGSAALPRRLADLRRQPRASSTQSARARSRPRDVPADGRYGFWLAGSFQRRRRPLGRWPEGVGGAEPSQSSGRRHAARGGRSHRGAPRDQPSYERG